MLPCVLPGIQNKINKKNKTDDVQFRGSLRTYRE
jgi:hypothetical protein